jgi:hypothetical protein
VLCCRLLPLIQLTQSKSHQESLSHTATAAAADADTDSFGGGNTTPRAVDEHRKAVTAAATATITAVGSISGSVVPERGLERANTQSSMDCGSS